MVTLGVATPPFVQKETKKMSEENNWKNFFYQFQPIRLYSGGF